MRSARLVRSALAVSLALLAAAPAIAKKRDDGATLDRERLEAIGPALEAEVAKGVRAGFVAGVATRDGEVFTAAVGMADRERGVAMTTDTRFRIASMTKPVITAAVMQLVDRGVVALDDPVSLYVPAYADARVATSPEPGGNGVIPTRPAKRPITIHDLLTHTAGIGYVFDASSTLDRMYLEANLFKTTGPLAERIEKIARLPLYDDPGEEWRYSYSLDVAAYVIEAATGVPLEKWLQENFFAPLKMTDTEFFVDKSDFERLAVVYGFDERGNIVRSAGSELSNDINEDGLGVLSGGAGLVSTVGDYLRFCQMMLNGGALDGARILSPSSARLMMSDNLRAGADALIWEKESATFGLGGSVVVAPGRVGGVAAEGEWSWSGLWDTWFVVNPKDGVAVVLLAQTARGSHAPRSRARSLVKAIAYGAVEN